MSNPVKSITTALGDDVIEAHLGVTDHSIRSARYKGVFPASWYLEMRKLCMAAGIDCPETAFNFKAPSDDAPSPEAAE